jgi:ketosteroid isomerase-like protein
VNRGGVPTVLPVRRPADPKVAITDLLDQYQRAYRAMNVNAVMEIYPSFTGKDALQKKFADLQDVAMALGVPDIQLTSPTTAKATVVYSLTYTSKSGKIDSTKPVRAEFALKKSGADWVIESVKFPGLRVGA